MRRLHIAVLTPGFAVDEPDTNCVPALQDFLLGLQRQYPLVEVTVFALRYPRTRRTYHWHGIPVHPANGRQQRFPASLLSWARLLRSVVGVHRRTPVHLIHSFWLGECAFLGERLSRLYGLPHIITLMGQEVAVRNRYAGLLKSKRTTFVAVSAFQRRALQNQTRHDADHVISWGITALPEPTGPREIDVLGVGSLTDVKDFGTFLDVVAQLKEARRSLSCRIAGDGPLRAVLEARARALQLQDTLVFEDRISRERVFDLMRRSKVLLHASTFESFGLVFAEALSCGARIVSRPVGIAAPSAAWAVCGDPAEMVAAVNRFLGEGNFTPQHTYRIEHTVNAYYELYRAACGLHGISQPAITKAAS